jgi:hypothetical protein
MLTLMLIGAKQSSSTPRKLRRTLPSAERRLRASFPEVWAWYELLVAARADQAEDTPQRPRRTLAR